MKSLFNLFDNIIVFDIETTGLEPKTDEIIELGAICVSKGESAEKPYKIDETLNALITLPKGRELSSVVTELTGITQEQLDSQGQPKGEICEKFVDILSKPKALLVAYNAQFDLNFAFRFLNSFGVAHVLKPLNLLDAMAVYKDRRDFPHKLSDAAASYNVINENAHRAVDDALTTLEILSAMGKEKDDLERYVNLFGYNPKYGVSGSKISSVTYKPQGYDRKKPLYEH